MLKTDRKRVKRGAIVSLLTTLKQGEIFFTELNPKGVTAYSTIYQVKVKTEICLVMSEYRSINPKVERITKVTIL